MRQRSCDDHTQYKAGCEPCNRRSRLYENRRVYQLMHGQRLSEASSLIVTQIRELRAAGYRLSDLERASGLNFRHLWELSDGRMRFVQLKTFNAVQKMYQELSPFPGPSNQASAWARRRGWTPPELPAAPEEIGEEVVDAIAVERAAAGDDSVCLTRAEKVAAWDLLGERGMSAAERIRFLRVGEQSIARWRGGFTRKNAKRTA